ncbi:MAG: hypothetical protein P8X97_04810 [Candidatus Bathyarchaeota archaeon]
MTNKNSLRDIEKKTYMSYHQDGLLDIFIGIYVLLFGIGISLMTMTDFNMWFIIPAIFPAIMIPIWISAKKRITMPRIGYVNFGIRGVNKMMAIFIGLMVAGLGVFMVFGLGTSMGEGWALTLRDFFISNSMLIISIGALIVSSLFAYTMGLKRLYGYGLLIFILFFTGHFITIPFEYFLLTIGFVIIISGFTLLLQFIRKYPLPQGDKINAQKSI